MENFTLYSRAGYCVIVGLANEKTVHVEAGEEGSFAVTHTIPKNYNKPRESRSKATKKNKNFRRTATRLGKEIHTVRPDLKVKFLRACRHVPRDTSFCYQPNAMSGQKDLNTNTSKALWPGDGFGCRQWL